MIKVLVIDNYDSFTWNLVQILRESGICEFKVVYNDQLKVEQCEAYSHLLFSPGPGLPSEAGITNDAIKHWSGKKNILGVCLGHQAIAEVFGARLRLLPHPAHGESSIIKVFNNQTGIFKELPEQFPVGRYHSWVVDQDSLPEELEISAVDQSGNIMALRHRNYPVFGVQFHPESILTTHGKQILMSWILI